eukprot:TRINITY_DN7616_c0_g1_i1.p1 TRINITY_DN7616_c0_g1~~TRINITY_DN7616_c0_g1_i1.p1  ORF type:complete len:291 (-),score=36.87 TRINITY_DN7616_c0_g1_i1:3-875(-)
MPPVTVVVVDGEGWRPSEVVGKSDPYCLVTLGRQKQKTKTHEKGDNRAAWNQALRFEHVHPKTRGEIAVMDDDIIKDDVLGRGGFDLAACPPGRPTRLTVPLQPSGHVTIVATVGVPEAKPAPPPPPAPQPSPPPPPPPQPVIDPDACHVCRLGPTACPLRQHQPINRSQKVERVVEQKGIFPWQTPPVTTVDSSPIVPSLLRANQVGTSFVYTSASNYNVASHPGGTYNQYAYLPTPSVIWPQYTGHASFMHGPEHRYGDSWRSPRNNACVQCGNACDSFIQSCSACVS